MVKHDALGALAALSEDEVRLVLGGASDAEVLTFDADWESWVREGQAPPEGAWRQWVMLAGRGFGKTRAGAEWVTRLAMIRPVRIALVGATIEEARRLMVEGESGILACCRPRHMPHPTGCLLYFQDAAAEVHGPEAQGVDLDARPAEHAVVHGGSPLCGMRFAVCGVWGSCAAARCGRRGPGCRGAGP